MLPFTTPGYHLGDGDIILPIGDRGDPFIGRFTIPTGILTGTTITEDIHTGLYQHMTCIIVTALFQELYINEEVQALERLPEYSPDQEELHSSEHLTDNGFNNGNQEALHPGQVGNQDSRTDQEEEEDQVVHRVLEDKKREKQKCFSFF